MGFSEWGMLKSQVQQESLTLFQDQWDFHEKDLSWLRHLQADSNADDNATMYEYLQSPRSPARNRQARYLLGFTRVCCRGGIGLCEANEPCGYPAFAYDWDRDHDKLLAQAKKHLSELRFFGLADCYMESMKFLPQASGWDPQEVAPLLAM